MRLCGIVLVLVMLAVGLGRAQSAEGSGAVPTEPPPGSVALTFDDGPDPRWTPVILDILDTYGVKATFFVVGWKVQAHPELVREMLARGHSVQSHSYGHGVLTGYGDEALRLELLRSVDAIREATGTTPTCLRPRQGITSDRVDAIARSVGLEVVIWDDDSGDWEHGSARVLRQWAAEDRWADGDAILAHETLGYLWELALGDVIEAIELRGLGFDTICLNLSASVRTIRPWFVPLWAGPRPV